MRWYFYQADAFLLPLPRRFLIALNHQQRPPLLRSSSAWPKESQWPRQRQWLLGTRAVRRTSSLRPTSAGGQSLKCCSPARYVTKLQKLTRPPCGRLSNLNSNFRKILLWTTPDWGSFYINYYILYLIFHFLASCLPPWGQQRGSAESSALRQRMCHWVPGSVGARVGGKTIDLSGADVWVWTKHWTHSVMSAVILLDDLFFYFSCRSITVL